MTTQIATTPDSTRSVALDRPSTEVYDRIQIVHLVEDALRDASWCSCGAQLTVEADDGTLWLECPEFREPSSGRLAWLRDGIRTVLHQRQVVARDVGLAA